jgi:hypothetical protein
MNDMILQFAESTSAGTQILQYEENILTKRILVLNVLINYWPEDVLDFMRDWLLSGAITGEQRHFIVWN